MPLDTWLLFVLVSLLPAISPGPAVLLAISNSLRFGARATAYSALGNAAGLCVIGFAVAYGLGALMTTSALAFTVIKLLGGLYLAYLGIRLWRNGTAFDMPDATAHSTKSRLGLFSEAFFVAITNPKAIVLLAALLPHFISGTPTVAEVGILSATYAVLCLLNHLALAALGGRIRNGLGSARLKSRLRRVLGATFVGFGASLAALSR